MMQRREACLQARLLTSKPFFTEDAQTIDTITSDEIQKVLAQAVEGSYSSNYNSRTNTLLKNIKSIGGHVMGSVHQQSSLRTLIHALIFNQGLFSIFLTINPADTHHPLTMHFAGIDFDLDNVLPEHLPSTYERAEIVASHPVATATFFHHFFISSILATLIEGGPGGGVLGKIKAYFVTVEKSYDINPRADLAACRLTPKPSTLNFDTIFQQDIIELVEQNNIHKHTNTCYKHAKLRGSAQKCRMRMPRKIIVKSEIDSVTGTISMKRNHEWINNFNEWIMSACRSNMDIKFVWSSSDAKALAYYVTDYVTKPSLSFHDSLALMVKVTKDFDKKPSNLPDNIHGRSRRLLLKMHNTLAS
ncbi:unnamed protein product [Rotaria sp. Silwood2]|nr:unnamed protein product [Rotaria sp. Silwood2]